jgi:hypothetical protein
VCFTCFEVSFALFYGKGGRGGCSLVTCWVPGFDPCKFITKNDNKNGNTKKIRKKYEKDNRKRENIIVT